MNNAFSKVERPAAVRLAIDVYRLRTRTVIQGAEMPDLPKKLTHDSIMEAILEVRFEHSGMAEVVVGQLAAARQWAGYETQRLPFADFPSVVRDADPNLRFQPLLQLVRPGGGEVVKIGPRVLSMHGISPYSGWDAFKVRLQEAVEALYSVCPNPSINRLGLRYINGLTAVHGVKGLWDLNIDFSVGGNRPADELMSVYRFDPSQGVRVQVNLASPSFVEGSPLRDAAVYVDVDVSTPAPLGAIDSAALMSWVEEAHGAEKEAFFSLWPPAILEPLREA